MSFYRFGSFRATLEPLVSGRAAPGESGRGPPAGTSAPALCLGSRSRLEPYDRGFQQTPKTARYGYTPGDDSSRKTIVVIDFLLGSHPTKLHCSRYRLLPELPENTFLAIPDDRNSTYAVRGLPARRVRVGDSGFVSRMKPADPQHKRAHAIQHRPEFYSTKCTFNCQVGCKNA